MAASTRSAPPTRGRYDWPWRGGPSFVPPDGSRVSLGGAALGGGPAADGRALDTSRPWSAIFVALVHGIRRTFVVAETGAFGWHSTYTTIPDEIHRYPYRGGELLLGVRYEQAGNEPGGYRAAWQGQWFELHTSGSGAPPATDRLSGIFDAFRLTDTPLGMLVAPRSVRQARMEPFQVAKQIPGLGYLTIERPEHSRIGVPDFRGHRTDHGELWREPLGAGAHGRTRPDALLLATPTAVTRLVAGPADSADPNTVLSLLTGLNVLWESA